MRSRRGSSRGSSHDFFSGGGGSGVERENVGNETTRNRRRQPDETYASQLPARMGGLQLLTRSSKETEERKAAGTFQPVILSPRSRTEHSSAEKSAPKGQINIAVPARKQATTSADSSAPKNEVQSMGGAKKLIAENMSFEDFIGEYLTDNTSFNVIGAIGPQGCGKSTILSMLGGNNPHDLYRHYVFRPASREAVESSRYQTMKIYAYVSKSRTILLDCQASNCASIMEEAIRHSRSIKMGDYVDQSTHTEDVELMAFMIQVCQTILVCCDWALDLELFMLVRTAEMIRANLDNFAASAVPSVNFFRRTNLVFLHIRAKSFDFSPPVRQYRAGLIRAMFADSRRIEISDDDDCVVIPLADLKPRKDNLTGMHAAPQQERLLEREEIVEFEKGVSQLRTTVLSLTKQRFAEQNFSEKHWFALARYIWKNPAFQSSVEQYGSVSLS